MLKLLRGALLFLCLCGTSHAFAAMGSLNGKIINEQGQPIPYATVALLPLHWRTQANAMGQFEFKNIPSGKYQLAISMVGYGMGKRWISIEDSSLTLKPIVLIKSSFALDDITVYGKYYKKYKVEDLSASLRMATPLLETSQNISIITADALKDQQITTLSDGVLRNVSGATRLEHWGDLYTRVNMRGSRAGAFLNGVNITSSWGPLSEDMSYVERIEFVKGPAGFLMSNGEPSGMYNIVTKKPTGKSFHGSITSTLGSFDLYRLAADVDSRVTDKLAIRLNLMGQQKNSFRPYEFNNRYIVAPSLRFQLTDKTQLTTEYIYQKVKLSDVGGSYIFSLDGYKTFPRNTSFSDPGIAPTKINDHTLSVHLLHQFSPNWKLTTQFSYLNNYMLGSSLWLNKLLPGGELQRGLGVWEAQNDMRFGQVFLNGRFTSGAITHTLLTGLDMGRKYYMADWNQNHNLDADSALFQTHNPNYQPPSNGYGHFDFSTPLVQRASPYGIIQQRYSGVYVQDELGFFENAIRFTLAGRLTTVHQSTYGGPEESATRFTPRVGLSASVTSRSAVYVLFDQAFVPQAGFLRNGQTVKPLTGNNMELGIKRDWLNGKWNTTLSAYRIVKNNAITADPNNKAGESFSIVQGQTQTKGLEFDVKGALFSGMNMIVNYAYTDSRITQSFVQELKVGDRVAGYAQHTANGWLNYTVQKGCLKDFGISGGFTFMGNRSSWAWATTAQQLPMDDYLKWDGGIFWGRHPLKITLNVFNLADAYLYSGSPFANYYYYQAEAPRNWRLSLAYHF